MALKDYPEWVLKHKGKGKEIRFLNGRYYLYEVHTERIDGKVRKFTDNYLGRITEDGLIPKTVRTIEYTVKNFGYTAFICSCCENIIRSIMNRFPSRYQKILSPAILKYFFSNDIEEYNSHYVSIIFPAIVPEKEKSSVINNEINRVTSMFNHSVTRTLDGIAIDDFRKSLSSLYIVGVKGNWTVAEYPKKIQELIDKYNIKLEVCHGKDQ